MAQPQRRSWWNFNQCLRLEGRRERTRIPEESSPARGDRSWVDGGVAAHVARTRGTRPKRRGHVGTDARSAQWRAHYASTARFPDLIHPPPPHPASPPIRPHGQRRRRCIQLLAHGLLSERQARADRTRPRCRLLGNDKSWDQGVQWHRHRHREEVLVHPHRRLDDRQGVRHLSQHRYRVLWNGPGLPGARREGAQERAGVLEGVRRISADEGPHAGDCHHHAASDTFRRSAAIRRIPLGCGMGHNPRAVLVPGRPFRFVLGVEGERDRKEHGKREDVLGEALQRRHQLGRRDPYCASHSQRGFRRAHDGEDDRYRHRHCAQPGRARGGQDRRHRASKAHVPQALGGGGAGLSGNVTDALLSPLYFRFACCASRCKLLDTG